MNLTLKNLIVIGTFLFIAGLGILLSFSAPYVKSGDEMVYLVGALQAEERNLPDANMLQGYDYGTYLYPQIMHSWYESLGYYTFKSIVLVILILATGLAGYAMFRLLWLPFVPALLMSVVVLIPRFTAGTEFFGVLTFREAVGRSSVLPLFLLGTAFLIRRIIKHESLWPVFGIFGLFMFLHPATVMVFSFVSLVTAGLVMLYQKVSLFKVIRELFISGGVYLLAGSYFFVDVVGRLAESAGGEEVLATDFVDAVVFRNTWEFPAASLDWFRHTAIVSFFFVVLLVIFYRFPALSVVRERYRLPNTKVITFWGLSMAVSSLLLTLIIPGINLYFMEHANAPYIFQQWSRIAKFYYLGLFVLLVPMISTLWHWYRSSIWRFKKIALTFLFVAGVLSSSFGFEVSQFIIGYPNFTAAYIPQILSGIQDDITDDEYREVCEVLEKLGAPKNPKIIAGDFALRYYCRADLYVTQEEGGAYTQLPRAELVAWHKRLLSQREVFNSADLERILNFAKSIDANFVVLPRIEKYKKIEKSTKVEIFITTRHIIVKVNK